MIELKRLTDEKLLALLSAEGDRLERAVVDEILRRGGMVDRLASIITDSYNWNEPLPAWWAVVHAVYILGAVGTTATVLPLLRAVRYADACENDWAAEDLPSIFGAIGPPAVAGLRSIAADCTTGWRARAIAIEGLAAVTVEHPDLAGEVFPFVHAFFIDDREEHAVRQMAGHVLLDLLRSEYRHDLATFGKAERLIAERDRSYKPAFTDEDVDQEFAKGERTLERYTRDWLAFYHPDVIAERQRRWDDERRDAAEAPDQLSPHELCPFAKDRKKKKCCLGKVGLA